MLPAANCEFMPPRTRATVLGWMVVQMSKLERPPCARGPTRGWIQIVMGRNSARAGGNTIGFLVRKLVDHAHSTIQYCFGAPGANGGGQVLGRHRQPDLRQDLNLETIGQADSARSHVDPHGWRNDRVEHLVRGKAFSNGVFKALSIIFHTSVVDGYAQGTCLISDA